MNELRHLAELREILKNHKISLAGKQLLGQVTFAPLVGIASSGRNTIIRELVKTERFHFIVSDTTRKHRVNDGVAEQDGVEYWFRTEEEVLADLKSGKFLEAAIIHNQQVSGISLRELERAAAEQKIAVTDMEVQGVDNLISAGASITPIFILPPDYDEWLRRLKKRGRMNEREVRNRMESAYHELSTALSKPYYHYLVNETLSISVHVVDKIASGHESARHASEAKEVARKMLVRLENELQNP